MGLGDGLLLFGVDLDEGHLVRARERLRELLEDGGDPLARGAPVGIDYVGRLRSVEETRG